jgi:predicted enzyme related to lactoylglutathione lyase
MKFDICIDVDDVDRAVEFYGKGLGLKVVESHPGWAHVKVDGQTIWLMKVPPGQQGSITRDYRRHWTPVHLDLSVEENLDAAVKRAVAAGGKLDGEIRLDGKGGGIATLSDPSGNGIDLVYRPPG